MIPVTVRLTFATTPQRPAAAWLVRGSSAEDWLTAAAHCPGDPEAVRILPLFEEAMAALLVCGRSIPESSVGMVRSGGFQPPQREHAPPVTDSMQSYGYAAERVLVPIEAKIEPPLTPDEWRLLSADSDALFVWHPSQGLVRFDPKDWLTIDGLLAGPPERPADWTAARTAPAYVDRLWSVVSIEPLLTMADVEAEWRQELGSRRPLDGLPKSPGESSLTWKERLAAATANFRAAWRRWFGTRATSQQSAGRPWISSELGGVLWTAALVLFLLLLMQWIDPLVVLLILGLLWLLFQGLKSLGGSGNETERSPPSSTGTRSVGTRPFQLGNWLRNQWEQFTQWRTGQQAPGSWMQQADQSLRRREVDRLLHMLEQNPDEGLRYAIPFGGDPGRGTGVTGNELVRRDLSFGLSSGGGGPADFWNIDPLQQIKLQQRYRELAEREQLAGRHRRAAYIYSQLLGDWNAAATALKSGQYYAEAAVIYHDRLHNLPQAAVCYELAGQPDEALRIYRDQKLWTAAGDLCEKLGRSEDAKSCYHAAVQHWVSTGDVRSAADVLETKLHDVDGALTELEHTWPGHHNADSYFNLWFTVAARHHRHEQAGMRIEKLASGNSFSSTMKLLPRLQTVRLTYPQAEVQHLAKESTLRLVSQRLPAANPAEAGQLAAFLPGLSPEDRLLPRDCQRYVDRRRAEDQSTLPRKAPVKPQLRLERRFPKDQGEPGRDFPGEWCFDPPGTRSVPAYVAEHWLSVKPMPSGLTHVLWIDNIGAAWLTTYTADGTTAKSQRFAEEWLIDPASVTVLLRDRSSIWPVRDDNILAVLPIGDDELAGECFDAEGIRVWSGVIEGRSVIGPTVQGSTQMLVLRDEGISLLEDIRMPGDGHVVLTGWSYPIAAFLPGGLAAIADDQTLTVFNVASGKSVMTEKRTAEAAVAIAPAGFGRFSVLRYDGEVEVWGW